jgi:hypothetical protein
MPITGNNRPMNTHNIINMYFSIFISIHLIFPLDNDFLIHLYPLKLIANRRERVLLITSFF